MSSPNLEPPVLRRVDQYVGQTAVRVAATQLDPGEFGGAERREILAEWIHFFANAPTKILHLDLVSRVTQELLDAVSGQTNLRSIDVKWGPYHDISPLTELRLLERVSLGGASQLASLAPLNTLSDLSALTVSQAHKLDDIAVIGDLTSLRALRFGNSSLVSDKSVVIADLSWVSRLSELRTLELPGTRILNPDLTPMLALKSLEAFGLPLRRSYRKQVFEFAEGSPVFATLAAKYGEFEVWRNQHRAT